MSYIQCPHCGQKALSVATRCPHCGHAFESRFWQPMVSGSRRRRIPVGLIIAGVLIAVVIVNAVQRELRVTVKTPSARPRVMAVAPTPPPRTQLPGDSLGPAADSPAAPTPTLTPPLSKGTERRYASTWVNVRAHRSGSAPVVRILEPGDAVMVDSLRLGWYRAVSDGQALGYVDGRLVGTAPEPTPR